MVNYSQTSWQEYTVANVLETLRFAPMLVTIDKTPVIHYTLPKELVQGELVHYSIVAGFKKISWTGIISAIKDKRIMVRLGKGSFRGFNAIHEFSDEGNLTCCRDEFSFQGFSDFTEEEFSKLMQNANVVYAVASRKDTKDILLSIESKKQTQKLEALDNSAAVG